MKTIKDWQIGFDCDHEQYWQGHGIAFTHYTDCATGCGSTLREALEDALDSLAQNDIDITPDLESEMTEDLASQIRKPYDLDTSIIIECDAQGEHKTDCPDCDGTGSISGELPPSCTTCDGTGEIEDTDPDCAICQGDWHYYVNIDVTLE